MQYLIPLNIQAVVTRPAKKRSALLRKKSKRPVIENCAWQGADVEGVPQEVLALCAHIRSELSKLEANAGPRSQLCRATKALKKNGAARIFKRLEKNGDSIDTLSKRICWSREQTLRLVSGEQIPSFLEIPKIASALKIETPTLLKAYGYPRETFQSTEALARAIMMEAERR